MTNHLNILANYDVTENFIRTFQNAIRKAARNCKQNPCSNLYYKVSGKFNLLEKYEYNLLIYSEDSCFVKKSLQVVSILLIAYEHFWILL